MECADSEMVVVVEDNAKAPDYAESATSEENKKTDDLNGEGDGEAAASDEVVGDMESQDTFNLEIDERTNDNEDASEPANVEESLPTIQTEEVFTTKGSSSTPISMDCEKQESEKSTSTETNNPEKIEEIRYEPQSASETLNETDIQQMSISNSNTNNKTNITKETIEESTSLPAKSLDSIAAAIVIDLDNEKLIDKENDENSTSSLVIQNDKSEPNCDVIEIEDDEEEWTQRLAICTTKETSSASNLVESNTNEEAACPEIKENNETITEITASSEIPENPPDPEQLLVEITTITANTKNDQSEEQLSSVPKDHCDVDDDDDKCVNVEVFYEKECINHNCPHTHKQYYRATQFVLSHFKVVKKKFKGQFVCNDCYNSAVDEYEYLCGVLRAKQPLYGIESKNRQDGVEIIDSSDDEIDDDRTKEERDCGHFSADELKMLEKELENTIKKVLKDVDIQNQLTWCKTILEKRLDNLEQQTKEHGEDMRTLMQKTDAMYAALYGSAKVKIRHLQPLDLNPGRSVTATASFMPEFLPKTEIIRPPIEINEKYYAVKSTAIASWVPCIVCEQVDGTLGAQKNLKQYKVKFLKAQYSMLRTVSPKHMAYYEAPTVQLQSGTRVIAYFDASSLSRGKEKMLIQSAFYPGIIAEPMKQANYYRYLIFYDDGYTQYVCHSDVRLVCHSAENVWEDVHPGSREFIHKYLSQNPMNRPMVHTQRGQNMLTESKGKWANARVLDIDCSLVHMLFEGQRSHTEWIYRGSQRLGPVYREYQKAEQNDVKPAPPSTPSRMPRRTEPFIRYTEDLEAQAAVEAEASTLPSATSLSSTTSQQQQQRERPVDILPRAVAKKSGSNRSTTSNLPPIVKHLNNSTIYVEDENTPKGKVVYYTAKRNMPPKTFKVHDCAPSCLIQIASKLDLYSPLAKPLLSGWQRLIMRQKIKKVMAYRAPCGRILRNMRDLHLYLRLTENSLNVDNFDFNPDINCLAEYVIDQAFVRLRDISNGLEHMSIPLVNNYDTSMPPECVYAAQRIPTEGVNLNLDENFLAGCDCVDDCSNKSKCSCWQLTYAGAKYGNPNTPIAEIGYQYKRLHENVPTGIYECNSRCKCKANCLNRVVQHSLQMKLQVFKTSNRGWGLRCLNDISRGSFICIYAGHLLTEAKANEGGLDAGDEYFAELDHIEVAEQIKEGYESDIESPVADDAEDTADDDEDFTPSKSYIVRQKKKTRPEDNDAQERQVINFNPNADMSENSIQESSMRRLFGKDEACYVMDAKITGNLGRYFNHSCSPNLFVQSVFVDTHDLRFPWVAFFASTNIRSGTELTWNYNYEVGVVPGKVLYCQCGAPNCRVRLL